MESQPVIQLEGIRKTYLMGPTHVNALKEATISIARGEMVAIMGPSGSVWMGPPGGGTYLTG